MSMEETSHKANRNVIYVAIVANVGIVVAKMIAAWITGSSAMLSEGLHSLVDTGNGALLLLGVRLSQKPADEFHPFGYGREVYFWTMVVALAVFALGGGLSIYEGIGHILVPHPLEHIRATYWVLACSLIFEGSSLLFAIRSFRRGTHGRPLLSSIRRSKDPAGFTVLFEDSAAVCGLTIALLATYLEQKFGFRFLDGAASVLIGVVLIAVAFLLGSKTKALLIGEGVDRATLREVYRIAEQEKGVERLGYPFTTFFGPHDGLLTMTVQFKPGFSSSQVELAVDRIEDNIQSRYPELKHIFLEVDTVRRSSPADVAEGHLLPQKAVQTPSAASPMSESA